MFQDLGWLAITACVYALAQLLHYAYLRLEDNSTHPLLQKILMVFCGILWLLSAPIAIIFGIINFLHFRRLEDKVRKDFNNDPQSHNYHNNSLIPVEIIAVVLFALVLVLSFQLHSKSDEIESLESLLEETYDEYNRGYENGIDEAKDHYYSKGYEDGIEYGAESGYEDGYNDGFLDGFAEGLDQ